MRISDWSSDVCSSDLADAPAQHAQAVDHGSVAVGADAGIGIGDGGAASVLAGPDGLGDVLKVDLVADAGARWHRVEVGERLGSPLEEVVALKVALVRSEEHTSELQSLMRISYAVFCLKKKTHKPNNSN